MPPWLCSSCARRSCAGASCSCVVVVRRRAVRRGRRASCVVLARPPRIAAERRRRPSPSSIQPPIATIETAATTGADRRRGPAAGPLRPDDQRGEDEDAERVRERDRQPEPGRVERRPARPDEVGGHQRLAVAGRQRVAGAQGRGGQDRDQQDERREVGGAEDRRQVAAGHATGHPGGRGRTAVGAATGGRRRRRRRRWRGDGRHLARPRQRRRVGDVERRERRPAGRGDDRDRRVRERLGQQVRSDRRSAGPSVLVRSAPSTAGQRDAGAGHHDLAPAEPLGEGRVGVADPRAAARGPRAAREAAHDAHRRQPADPRRERQPGLGQGEVRRAPSTRRCQRRLERVAGGHPPGIGLRRRRPRRRRRCRSRDAPGRSGSRPGR